MGYKLYFVLSLVALVVLFIFQNMEVVEIRFLFWSISMSRSLMIFLVFFSGAVAGWFLHSYSGYRKKKGMKVIENIPSENEEV